MDKSNVKRAAERPPARVGEDEDGTRERILKTAERLFAERGFNGVSVRELAAAANVNIASIGYHFRNKEGLLAQVYRRHCEPMIEERLRGLAAATRLAGTARVAAIIEAFVRPALAQVDVVEGETFIRLRAVLSGENSELLEKLVADNFDQSSSLHRCAVRVPAASVADRCLLALSLPARHRLLHGRRTAPHSRVLERPLRSRRHAGGHQGAGSVHDPRLPGAADQAEAGCG